MFPEDAEFIDITRPLSAGTEPWPGDAPFRRTEVKAAGWTVSRLRMSAHSGTHMDAPRHRIEDGTTVDRIPPDRLFVPALVCSSAPDDFRGRAVLLPGGVTGAEADRLVSGGAVLVGTSSMSVDLGDSDEAHRILLGADIPVVENLMLEGVEQGAYTLVCLPLRIEGGDGSPVRAFLVRPRRTASR
jgi:arylformamidase